MGEETDKDMLRGERIVRQESRSAILSQRRADYVVRLKIRITDYCLKPHPSTRTGDLLDPRNLLRK
jgi:hypothetical protein